MLAREPGPGLLLTGPLDAQLGHVVLLVLELLENRLDRVPGSDLGPTVELVAGHKGFRLKTEVHHHAAVSLLHDRAGDDDAFGIVRSLVPLEKLFHAGHVIQVDILPACGIGLRFGWRSLGSHVFPHFQSVTGRSASPPA